MDIQDMFRKMVEVEASDLYLTVARPPMYRVEGKIRPIGEQKFTPDEMKILADSVMTERQRREFAEALE
ncbi:MAG: type IV pili twitching motility protein PilT, partial [Candidatus Binatota bacterium]|nr:type IV pili twitching motility protein PilT [Candidatus Binatota bacterium]